MLGCGGAEQIAERELPQAVAVGFFVRPEGLTRRQ
jgi:hypothetical protein